MTLRPPETAGAATKLRRPLSFIGKPGQVAPRPPRQPPPGERALRSARSAQGGKYGKRGARTDGGTAAGQGTAATAALRRFFLSRRQHAGPGAMVRHDARPEQQFPLRLETLEKYRV